MDKINLLTFLKEAKVKGGERIMRKLALLGLVLALTVSLGANVFAQDEQIESSVSINVLGGFYVEFYDGTGADTPPSYPTGGPLTFTDVNPAMPIVYPDNTVDGASDVGVLCQSNQGIDFYLQLSLVSGTLPTIGGEYHNFVVWTPEEVYYRNTETSDSVGLRLQGQTEADGVWQKMWDTPYWIYHASGDHQNTLPHGTLIGLNFALVPSGSFVDGNGNTICSGSALPEGAQSGTIYYTMVATP